MIHTKTALAGVVIINVQKMGNERGFFAHGFDATEAGPIGVNFDFSQTKIKLIRSTRSAIHDTNADARPGSPTFCRHVLVELPDDNWRALLVPRRFAHGYQMPVDSTEVTAQFNAANALLANAA